MAKEPFLYDLKKYNESLEAYDQAARLDPG